MGEARNRGAIEYIYYLVFIDLQYRLGGYPSLDVLRPPWGAPRLPLTSVPAEGCIEGAGLFKCQTFAIFVPALGLGFVSEIMQVYKYYIEGPFHMTNPRLRLRPAV